MSPGPRPASHAIRLARRAWAMQYLDVAASVALAERALAASGDDRPAQGWSRPQPGATSNSTSATTSSCKEAFSAGLANSAGDSARSYWQVLLRRADDAALAAKRSGRGGVVEGSGAEEQTEQRRLESPLPSRAVSSAG